VALAAGVALFALLAGRIRRAWHRRRDARRPLIRIPGSAAKVSQVI